MSFDSSKNYDIFAVCIIEIYTFLLKPFWRRNSGWANFQCLIPEPVTEVNAWAERLIVNYLYEKIFICSLAADSWLDVFRKNS